ncbi:MAG: DUF1080 domain-containing protein [Acidobacteriota bacterium]|nr:MAG: DUF1080 domain-containing protein [Acidobacteriota bacterium]
MIAGAIAPSQDRTSNGKWTPIFNGRNLEGWTPKIKGYQLGENFGNTFRVENGVIRVSYDKYDKFNNRFGHLFYREKLSNYRLRVEYRFTGDQAPEGPGWAFRNSGAMLHCQDPKSMGRDQDFPVSVEIQFLGGNGKDKRSTGNMCSPGTHVVMGGKLITQHCVNSTSQTYHGDQWVTMEIEVRGGSLVRSIVNGETVLELTDPQLDDKDADALKLLEGGSPKMVTEGYIALQAESHPIEFRKVELMKLK